MENQYDLVKGKRRIAQRNGQTMFCPKCKKLIFPRKSGHFEELVIA